MSKRVILVAVTVACVLAVVIATVILRSNEAVSPSSVEQSSSADTSTSQDPKPSAASTTIEFTDNGFSPAMLTITKGTEVTVKNTASQPVQFSSDDHPTHRINQGMNLRVLEPGESASFMADKVGSWGFHDHIDASKTGTLTVTD